MTTRDEEEITHPYGYSSPVLKIRRPKESPQLKAPLETETQGAIERQEHDVPVA